MTDAWQAFLDILGPELAGAAIAAGTAAPPPPVEVGDVLRAVFTADGTGQSAASSADAA